MTTNNNQPWKERKKEYFKNYYQNNKDKQYYNVKKTKPKQNFFTITINGITFLFNSRNDLLERIEKVKREDLETLKYVKAV